MRLGRLNHVGVATPSIEKSLERYRTLFGAVPDSVRARWWFSAEHGRPAAPALLEDLRAEVITRSPLGLKVQQLVQFAQLAALGRADAARHHAHAAVRAGADAVLAATVFHFGTVSITDVKRAIADAGFPVRLASEAA